MRIFQKRQSAVDEEKSKASTDFGAGMQPEGQKVNPYAPYSRALVLSLWIIQLGCALAAAGYTWYTVSAYGPLGGPLSSAILSLGPTIAIIVELIQFFLHRLPVWRYFFSSITKTFCWLLMLWLVHPIEVWVVNQGFVWYNVPRWIMSIVLPFFFASIVYGGFLYHKQRRQARNPIPQPAIYSNLPPLTHQPLQTPQAAYNPQEISRVPPPPASSIYPTEKSYQGDAFHPALLSPASSSSTRPQSFQPPPQHSPNNTEYTHQESGITDSQQSYPPAPPYTPRSAGAGGGRDREQERVFTFVKTIKRDRDERRRETAYEIGSAPSSVVGSARSGWGGVATREAERRKEGR